MDTAREHGSGADALSQVIQKVSTAIYQQAAAEAQAAQQQAGDSSNGETWSGNPTGDDKTFDADYEVTDDKDKKDSKK